MTKRRLASIQVIHDIRPIENADRIESVGVIGWRCVASKGQFKERDKCVYFEIDSFLPIEPAFEFLRTGSYKNDSLNGEGFRLRTQKFRGQISQGLVMPLSILEEKGYTGSLDVGTDLTEFLHVKQWQIEETVTSSGTIIGPVPFSIPKTNELRVQSYPGLIGEMKRQPYYITTKMDGTSVTIYRMDKKFGVCGHNYEYANDGKCDIWRYMEKMNVEQKMSELNLDDIAIQGEFCGPGIQKNRLRLASPEWYVFTVLTISTRKRWSMEESMSLAKMLGLHFVPVEETGDVFPYDTVEQCLERAKGKYQSGSNKEGVVVRPQTPVYSEITQENLSMKLLNNEYLLKD